MDEDKSGFCLISFIFLENGDDLGRKGRSPVVNNA